MVVQRPIILRVERGEARVGGGIRWSELKWIVIRREGDGERWRWRVYSREELSYCYVFICIFFLFYLICSRYGFSYYRNGCDICCE